MTDEEIFDGVGFQVKLKSVFLHLCSEIRGLNPGCSAVYKPPIMKEARAAYFGPGEKGKNAQKVFVMIRPKNGALAIVRRKDGAKGKPAAERTFCVHENFSDWDTLLIALREWYKDPSSAKPPKNMREFGDGKSLAGGLPFTNRSKF